VRALLRITGEAPASSERPALTLSVVLDRSGSMHMEKLERAREVASLLVRRLGDDDVVSIVVYDDSVDTVARRCGGAEREEVVARIGARELVAASPVDGGVNRVLLLTDGLANVGITDSGQLRGLVASAAAAGVTTTTIGFGADYDEALLHALAAAGGGSTYYIETPARGPRPRCLPRRRPEAARRRRQAGVPRRR
jgi:Ca-activated chloride channel homolog